MKSVSKFNRVFPCILLACTLLTGCLSLGALTGGTDEFDGVWAGRFTFSSGENACVRRGGVRAEISQGDVDGDVSWQDSESRSSLSGFIKEGGTFTGTASRGSRSFAELEGTFSELNAEGTWKSSRCRGAWSMRKVRNAS